MNKTKPELTEAQYNTLNTPELEWFLKTAHYSQFITGLTTKQAKIFFDIYNNVFHARMKTTTCAQCRLEVCQKLGRLFYEYRDNHTENGEYELGVEAFRAAEEKKQEKPKTTKKQQKGGKK